ncbi:hypothetical protein ES703_96658 [subsurface metagenome]
MPIWHNVVSVSGLKVRYNPHTKVLALKCARLALIKLRASSDSCIITVQLSQSNPHLSPPYPPEKSEKPQEPNLAPQLKEMTLGIDPLTTKP